MALLSSLKDSFESGIFSTNWTVQDNSHVLNINNQVEITCDTVSNYYQLISNATYDLTSSYAYTKITYAGNQSLASFEAKFYIQLDSSNILYWSVNGNAIKAFKLVAGSLSFINSISYVPASHKWFRIRESGGTTFFDYSADNVTYSNLASLANPFAITSIIAGMQAGTFSNEGVTSTAKFDNFNYRNRTPTFNQGLTIEAGGMSAGVASN